MADDPAVKAEWSENVSQKLTDLWTTKEGADVVIRVGNRSILAHKFVLEINSEILKVGDLVNGAKKNNMTEVYIDQEFNESTDLIEELIKGFYIGSVTVGTNEELKMAYKFATNFSVKWMMNYLLKRFQGRLNENTFLETHRFANMIGCEKLINICLNYMNNNVAHALVESGDLFKMDFHCISRFTLLDNPDLSEFAIFEMISKWFEHDVENRKCHIVPLLSRIRLHLIHKDDLNSLQTWIMASEVIDGETGFIKLVKEIHKQMKNTANTNAHKPKPGIEREPGAVNSSILLQRLTDIVNEKGKDVKTQNRELSSAELATVVREKFSNSNRSIQLGILEYLSDNWKLIDKDIVTEFTKLPEFETSNAITRLIKKATAYKITLVQCSELSYKSLCKFLRKTLNWGDLDHWTHAIAGMLDWGRSHPTEVDKMPELLKTVFVCSIPSEYIKTILHPYLPRARYNVQGTLEVLRCCRIHLNKALKPSSPLITVKALPEEIYLLKRHTFDVMRVNETYNTSGYLMKYGINMGITFDPTRTIPLQMEYTRLSNRTSTPSPIKFILFDKEQCMDRCPTYTLGNLSLAELRELFSKYSSLHVMVFTCD